MPLTIVTSCDEGYAQYLEEWAASIVAQREHPARVCIFTHGADEAQDLALKAFALIAGNGIPVRTSHELQRLDFGTARNRAVAMAETDWVMHLDADDLLMPHAVEDFLELREGADVVAFGYERSGDLAAGPANKTRTYRNLSGAREVLEATAPCSGVSPFRKALWEASPYRTDMVGAWDTALWVGFAHRFPQLRIRATTRPVFWYRQHADSVFNRRRKAQDWTRAITEAQLGQLRRQDRGVSLIVPLADSEQRDRERIWQRLKPWWAETFPSWEIVEGRAPGAGAWVKGAAVDDALARASGEFLVIADADVTCSPGAIQEALRRVEEGLAPWAIPHGLVHRLAREASTAALAPGQPVPVVPGELLDRPAYQGLPGGGLLVVPRLLYQAVGGFPKRFVGWGSEDQALATILDTCGGAHWRGAADLVHFWHAPQERKASSQLNQQQLRQIRQVAARGRDVLIEYLRTGKTPDALIPSWKRRGLESSERRKEARRAAGLPDTEEPSWIQAVRKAQAARHKQRLEEANNARPGNR
jgi:hypothetical protein